MKAVSIFSCVLLLAACDQSPKASSTIASKTETVRTMAGGASENVTLIEETEASVVDAAGQQLVSAQYACSHVNHLWLVNFTAKQDAKILKVECAEGEYQLTLFDNKAFSKPWTGDLVGN